MVALVELKFVLKVLGLNAHGGFANYIMRSIHFCSLFSTAFSVSIYFIENLRTNVRESFAVVYVLFICGSFTTTFLDSLIHRNAYFSLMDDLKYLTAKPDARATYAKSGEKISFFTRIFLWFSALALMLAIFPFVVVGYHWIVGDYTIRSWIYLFPIWSPFELDTTPPLNVLIICAYIFTGTGGFCVVPTILIAFLFHSEACVVDMKSIFRRLERLSSSKNSKSEMIERCKELVDVHENLNRLMPKLAHRMAMVFCVMIVCWSACVSISLFLNEKNDEYGSNSVYDILIRVTTTVFLLNALTIIYYIGQRFHTNLIELSDEIYLSNWYRYPRSVQKFMLLIMMRSQQSFYLTAYGISNLNMKVYLALLKKMYSFFMVLHNVN